MDEIRDLANHAWPLVDEAPTKQIETIGELVADLDRTTVLLGNLFRNVYEHGSGDVTIWTGISESRAGGARFDVTEVETRNLPE